MCFEMVSKVQIHVYAKKRRTLCIIEWGHLSKLGKYRVSQK